jgi:hypothetical protein
VAVQPAGTVTFVFTDIEGSTALLDELGPEAFKGALADHRRAVREGFGAYSGYEVDDAGDGLFYAFASASAAVTAVAQAIASFADGSVRSRVGVHTGEPLLDPPKYVGPDVHKAARIMSAAHGGQALLSGATHELVAEDVLDLGRHRLKDFAEPDSLFQLGSDRFPPLRTISNTNLPVPLSSFGGREQEVTELVSLVRDEAADPRQQTLRATIAWSYDLLAADEQRLFARMAVFRGGCTLESAEQVAGADVAGLQSLHDKSLLRRTGERFWMLETIREYAHELLDGSTEGDAVGRGHADHFLALGVLAYTERFDHGLTEVRQAIGAVIDEPDPLRKLERYADIQPGVQARLTPLYRTLAEAAAVEPQLASVWEEREEPVSKAWSGWTRLDETGSLREEVTPEEARDVLWTIDSHAVCRMLVTERGWSRRRYRDCLARTHTPASHHPVDREQSSSFARTTSETGAKEMCLTPSAIRRMLVCRHRPAEQASTARGERQ